MITAYNLTDTIIRSRKRPSSTSTSAFITQSIFGTFARKDLSVLIAIDAYNHYMGGVDIGNQLRASFTILRPKNLRYWKPLFYWLLDIALVNSYLLAKAIRMPVIVKSKYNPHWRFLEALAKALMNYSEVPEHNQILRPTRAYCAYCRNNQSNWQSKHQQQQSFGADIINIGDGSGGRFRGSKTQWACDQCNIALCKTGNCWCLWHEKFN